MSDYVLLAAPAFMAAGILAYMGVGAWFVEKKILNGWDVDDITWLRVSVTLIVLVPVWPVIAVGYFCGWGYDKLRELWGSS